MRRRATLAAGALLLPLLPLTACSGAGGAPPRRSITVLAAASLTEALTDLGPRFPAAKVTFSFDASSSLVQQVKVGAPADLLATADEATMQQAVDAGAVGPPEVFAHNRLAIIVGKGNPKGVRGLADLARADVLLVQCAPEVPCGRFAAQALARAGVTAAPRSLEPNVKGVVAKVVLGEADAGVVYVTDVKAAGAKAQGVPIPDGQNVIAAYLIAALRSSANAARAAAFVAFVRSPEGRSVLAAAGFDP